MTDLYNFQGEESDGKSKGPAVYVLNHDDEVDLYPTIFTGKWLLKTSLFVQGGGEEGTVSSTVHTDLPAVGTIFPPGFRSNNSKYFCICVEK